MLWAEIRYIWMNFLFFVDSGWNNKYLASDILLELQTMGKDRRLRVSNSAEGLKVL